jgi:hypothetical protein
VLEHLVLNDDDAAARDGGLEPQPTVHKLLKAAQPPASTASPLQPPRTALQPPVSPCRPFSRRPPPHRPSSRLCPPPAGRAASRAARSPCAHAPLIRLRSVATRASPLPTAGLPASPLQPPLSRRRHRALHRLAAAATALRRLATPPALSRRRAAWRPSHCLRPIPARRLLKPSAPSHRCL